MKEECCKGKQKAGMTKKERERERGQWCREEKEGCVQSGEERPERKGVTEDY